MIAELLLLILFLQAVKPKYSRTVVEIFVGFFFYFVRNLAENLSLDSHSSHYSSRSTGTYKF